MVRLSKELSNASGDTSGRIPKRRQDGQLSRLAAQLGNNVLAIVGVVTSIAGFVGLVASKQLRNFVEAYSYPTCISLIVVLLAFLVSLNYAQTVRRQRNQLQAAADRLREPRPSAHDIRLFAEVLAELPLDGPVITWLRRTNTVALGPANVPADVLTALERTVRRLERRPVGFDDDMVARALADFIATVETTALTWRSGRLCCKTPPRLTPLAVCFPMTRTRSRACLRTASSSCCGRTIPSS